MARPGRCRPPGPGMVRAVEPLEDPLGLLCLRIVDDRTTIERLLSTDHDATDQRRC